MKEKKNNKGLSIKEGIISGFPIVIGYIPIAMAFGILSKTAGISIVESCMFSAFVFAGASQFMALNLLSMGVGIGEIVLTTLLVNFRHFLMSASLAARFTNDMKRWTPFISFGITDEIFSVASFKEEQITTKYMLSLQVVSYLSWVLATALGYLLGEILPVVIKDSMGIALYAMFAAILIPEAKKSNKVLLMAISSGLINTALNYFEFLPQGWNLVLSIVLVSFLGCLDSKERQEGVYE